LNALAAIVQNLDPKLLYPDENSEESLQASASSSPPRPETAAFPFLVAVVLWFDLLSCVSTGTGPRLAYRAILHDYHISLEDVVGCQNWAMVAIGDLAILDLWKKQAQQDDSLSEQELLLRSQSVREQLEEGLAALESKFNLSSTGENSQHPATERSNNVVYKVTSVFASAAFVQLYTIVHGAFPGHPDIQIAIQKTIEALEQVQDLQDMRGLIWPICISGCMADEHQQFIFEDLIQRVVGESLQDFGNSTTALRIMQKCWKLRLANPNTQWNWQSTMVEMDICGLLV
jgi:hypothetical protein